jgi:hypothetical protein
MIKMPWQDSEETRANKEQLAKNLAEKKELERADALAESEREADALPCYQVGVTKDGRVTMRLGGETYYSTLTMTSEGVDRMIRMLEAAKDQCMESACDSEYEE